MRIVQVLSNIVRIGLNGILERRVDTWKLDAEVKLLIACTDQEIEVINKFHNQGKHMSGLVIRRERD